MLKDQTKYIFKNTIYNIWGSSQSLWQRWIDLPEVKSNRFWLLLFGAIIGIALAAFATRPLVSFFCFYKIESQFQILLLGLPVFVLLWWFRTYDSRQQIEKSEQQIKKAEQQIEKSSEQIHQSNYFKGLDNLTSDEPLNIDIGVMTLLEVSRVTNLFDKEIRLAFIKRLRTSPKYILRSTPTTERTNRMTYAQYILQWLINYQKNHDDKKPDLSIMDCRSQEFVLGEKLNLREILPENPNSDTFYITFEEANCKDLNFLGLHLNSYDVTKVTNLNYEGAYIYIHSELNEMLKLGGVKSKSNFPIGIDEKLFYDVDRDIRNSKKPVDKPIIQNPTQ